ncbi:dinitrogenase iron-molybdenum cofactor biosynthesis protein [bacterium]|nr:dinitrogenase iron-molybdenum cofactor biosynthesis protein [bacterium]
MKVAFTTTGDDLAAPLDRRFGRAPKFLIYDTDTESFEIVDNQQNLNAAQGAGIQAAETAVRLGVSCVVTGHCGPKAFRVLTAARIGVFSSDAPSVQEALERMRLGQLRPLLSADMAGHRA